MCPSYFIYFLNLIIENKKSYRELEEIGEIVTGTNFPMAET